MRSSRRGEDFYRDSVPRIVRDNVAWEGLPRSKNKQMINFSLKEVCNYLLYILGKMFVYGRSLQEVLSDPRYKKVSMGRRSLAIPAIKRYPWGGGTLSDPRYKKVFLGEEVLSDPRYKKVSMGRRYTQRSPL